MDKTQEQIKLQMAAKKLLDNEDYSVLLKGRMNELTQETMSGVDDREILAAHREYHALGAFIHWVSLMASNGRH